MIAADPSDPSSFLRALLAMDQGQFLRLLATLGAGVPGGLSLPAQSMSRMSRMTRPELRRLNCPDRLPGWTLPPLSARAIGEVEPVRVFESAEAATAFLAEKSLRVP